MYTVNAYNHTNNSVMKFQLHSLFAAVTLLSIPGALRAALFDLSPDYHQPEFSDTGTFDGEEHSPELPELSPRWWTLFEDSTLSHLIEIALEHNQDLAAAASRVDQARALAGQARADLFPQLSATADLSRRRSMENGYQANSYINIPGRLSYEIDLWGGVSNGASAAATNADAQQYHYEALNISLSAQVAETVYLLRATQREESIVKETVRKRSQARDVVAARYELGTATELDLTRSDTELAMTEAELAQVSRQAAQLTNALILLTGQSVTGHNPEEFGTSIPNPPDVPVGLPAQVLRNRPDVAAAERSLAAQSSQIGVAKAAFYPSIRITASAGWESDEIDGLFSGNNRVWSIGPQIYLPLFQGNRNKSRLAHAIATFEERESVFRQTVLTALREVQDALIAGRLLAEQSAANHRAVISSRKAVSLSRTRYEAGYVGHLELIDSERVALSVERAQTQLKAQQLVATITLIKALGGGWTPPAPILAKGS